MWSWVHYKYYLSQRNTFSDIDGLDISSMLHKTDQINIDI